MVTTKTGKTLSAGQTVLVAGTARVLDSPVSGRALVIVGGQCVQVAGSDVIHADDLLVRRIKVTAHQSTTSTSFSDVTELVFPVLSGHYYEWTFLPLYDTVSGAGGVGIKFTVTVPTFDEFAGSVFLANAGDGTAAELQGWITSSGDGVVSTNTGAGSYVGRVAGLLLPNANGNLQLQFGTATGGSAARVRKGSVGTLIDYGT